MDFSTLKFPNKSHRKHIKIPLESGNLAELMGIAFGDGGINNLWQLVISLNSKSDLDYSKYVRKLIEKLFKIDVAVRKRPNQNTLVLVCSSSDLVDFLVEKGAVRGNKVAQQIDIPKWIKSNLVFKKRFVRGLVDTDGCLFNHRHIVNGKKRNDIGFCFTSGSKKLIVSVAKIFEQFGIVPHITDSSRRIYLYSVKAIRDYLRIFGSSNRRILKKWRGG